MADGKVTSGESFYPPPAAVWNNMIDAGRAWSDGRLNNNTPAPIRSRSTDIIKAVNTSGTQRRRGEVLEISGKALSTLTDENKRPIQTSVRSIDAGKSKILGQHYRHCE